MKRVFFDNDTVQQLPDYAKEFVENMIRSVIVPLKQMTKSIIEITVKKYFELLDEEEE
jgi:hypothetical protein